MNCLEILLEAGLSKKRAKEYEPGLRAALKKRGLLKKEKVLESRDITEPKMMYTKSKEK